MLDVVNVIEKQQGIGMLGFKCVYVLWEEVGFKFEQGYYERFY